MADEEQVVLSGLGVVSPCGTGKDEFWKNVLGGGCFLGPVTRFDASRHLTRIAGEVKDFVPREFISENEVRRYDRTVHFSLAAAKMAVKDAGLDFNRCDRTRVGVLLGSCHGPIESIEREILAVDREGPQEISPFAMANASTNIASGAVAIQLGLKGPNFSVVSACASGTQSIGEAYRKLARGEADVFLVGGVEACITNFTFSGYAFISAMSRRNDAPERACRPFDAKRDGFVMSEGAGMVVLERLDHAKRRGARVYAEIIGYGASNEAAHVINVSPIGTGARQAMYAAIDSAGLCPEEIDYLNTHGSSTALGDRSEARAICDLFGAHASNLLVNSTKSITGHMMGASGAIEAIVCALSLRDGIVHGTRNFESPDPDCALETVTSRNVRRNLRFVLSTSIGFGGSMASLVMRSVDAR